MSGRLFALIAFLGALLLACAIVALIAIIFIDHYYRTHPIIIAPLPHTIEEMQTPPSDPPIQIYDHDVKG